MGGYSKDFYLETEEKDYSDITYDFDVKKEFSSDFVLSYQLSPDVDYVYFEVFENTCMNFLIFFSKSGDTQVNYYPFYGYYHFVNEIDDPDYLKEEFDSLFAAPRTYYGNSYTNPFKDTQSNSTGEPIFFQVFCMFKDDSKEKINIELNFNYQNSYFECKIYHLNYNC
jgi:hypothetical protein